MTKYEIRFTAQFKRDIKLAKKQNKDLNKSSCYTEQGRIQNYSAKKP